MFSKKLLPQSQFTVADILVSLNRRNNAVLIILINLICANSFIKVYDLIPLSMNLQKSNVSFYFLEHVYLS